MDSDEVVAHGKMVVHICERASTVDPVTFWAGVLNCKRVGYTPLWYDVFHLLADLELVVEAEVLHRVMANDPKSWCWPPPPDSPASPAQPPGYLEWIKRAIIAFM